MFRCRRVVWMVLTVGLTVMAAPKEKTRSWNFDADKAGDLPPELELKSGEWKVVLDDTAPSKPHALAQLGKGPEKQDNIVFLKDVSARNFDLEVHFLPAGGSIDQGCGIIFRAQDEKNYYLYRYNSIRAEVRVYKVVDGQRIVVYSLDGLDEKPGWQSIRIVTNGERLEGHLDGEARFSILDRAFQNAGRLGLWTEADAQTHFDNLRLEIMDR